jgi:hypothetical protein
VTFIRAMRPHCGDHSPEPRSIMKAKRRGHQPLDFEGEMPPKTVEDCEPRGQAVKELRGSAGDCEPSGPFHL